MSSSPPCPVPCTPAPPQAAPHQYQQGDTGALNTHAKPTNGEAPPGTADTEAPTNTASVQECSANTRSAPAHPTTQHTKAGPAPTLRQSPTTGRKTDDNW